VREPAHRRPRTLRTVVITVLSTLAVVFAGLCVLGATMPAQTAAPTVIIKSTTVKHTS
jgi:uncharacterized membrane protein YesL